MSLGAHDVVADVGHARGRWGSHDSRDNGVVARRPADRRQVESGIFRSPVIFEAADAGVEIENRRGIDVVVVSSGKRVGRVFLRTTIDTQAIAEGIDGKIQHIPIAESEKQPLLVADVLVDACDNLVLVSACSGDRVEVVYGS